MSHAGALLRTGLRVRVVAQIVICVMCALPHLSLSAQARPRARDLGVAPGIFATGPLNAITDVAGVRVGQTTIADGDSINTGVTAILPHGGNLYRERVPAALHVGNGFGKLLGVTQLAELGELETPILLTCTLCVWKAADAMVEWLLEQPGMGGVRSINPTVGETNDGGLNDIRSRPLTAEAVRSALTGATGGEVEEGSVGAGRGTQAFGWKGGIGTSSRVLGAGQGGFTVGVLVQSNFGGQLQILGAPVGRELAAGVGRGGRGGDGRSGGLRADGESGAGSSLGAQLQDFGDGSIMIVVATDAPLSDRNLGRVAARAIMGLGRTGSSASNGSGDYVIAFSTSEQVRRTAGTQRLVTEELNNDAMSAVFQAVVEATEEAIYNSLLRATAVSYRGRTVEALPIDRVREILVRYNVGGR